jgi:predicted dehydrogenase/nucleoside-diphosphate-sugar epimerase
MKVLITGASGFLGGHLAELFTEAGHQVRGLVRQTSQTGLLEQVGAEIVRGDLKDPGSLARAVEGIEVVVHAASTMSGVPDEYVEATINGTRALFEAAERAAVRRVVHISSISVYPIRRTRGGEAVTEDAPYEDRPVFMTNYTKSKIGSDRVAMEFAERGAMEVFVLRPGILYGPRGRWNLPRMGYGGMKRYLVVGNGKLPLPVCYVRGCAKAVLLAAESSEKGAVLTLVDDESYTQLEYLRRIRADVRPRYKITRVPYVLMRLASWCAGLGMKLLGRPPILYPSHLMQCKCRVRYSNSRARGVLGAEWITPKEEGLAATMRDLAERERISRRSDLKALGRPPRDKPPLRACLIGCGVIAREHIGILRRMKNAEVVGVCDLSADAAAELARESGVEGAYTDVAEMLGATKPDVVHILTPPQSHAEYARVAAENGVNILVEKPMAVNAVEAQAMADCAAEHGVALCVGHNHVYDPTMVKARRLVESGALGDIIWVESYYGFNLGKNPASRYMAPGGADQWTFRIPGGLYQNLIAHPLSVALDVIGAPEKIEAHGAPSRVLQHQPTDELRVALECGRRGGLITLSLAASPRFQYLKIYGTEMVLTVNFLDKWVFTDSVMRGVPRAISRALMNLRRSWTIFKGTAAAFLKYFVGRWTPFDGMEVLIREYYAALQEGRKPPCSAEEGVAVMRVMDETWRQIGPLVAGTERAEASSTDHTEDDLQETP